MPPYPRQVLSVRDLNNEQVGGIFSLANQFKSGGFPAAKALSGRLAALVFLEPSTRTRMSFEIAAKRLGLAVSVFSGDGSTSMAKGETALDTLKNIASMGPDLLVCRHGDDAQVSSFIASQSFQVINAGDGANEHPTQGLLDALTVLQRRGQIEGERIVYLGDVEHSRVARSGLRLFSRLGAEVAFCSPEEWTPKSGEWADIKKFSDVREAMSWATVCVGLRIQFERHKQEIGRERRDDIVKNYQLSRRNVETLAEEAIIMHPGPFVPGVDVDTNLLDDSRIAIYDQVSNGVYVRAALLLRMLEDRS